ncbi:MAG: Methyl-accepting chemotaxis protein [Mycobacterium sp.]|nr:Methyl-accepting chemotaxis protein [Mycobacterium sp.]
MDLAAVAVRLPRLRDAGNRLQADAHQLQADVTDGGTAGIARADALLGRLQADSRALGSAAGGAAWTTTAVIPGLSGPLDAAQALAADARTLTDGVLPDYLRLLHSVRSLSLQGGATDLAPLLAARGPAASAAAKVDALQTTIDRRPISGVPQIARAQRALAKAVGQLHGYAKSIDVALAVAPDLLGADGPRTTLAVLESPAESRGTGGLVGGYVLLRAQNGRITVVSQGTQSQMGGVTDATGLPADFVHTYEPLGVLRDWRATPLSPDFPVTAQVWRKLWAAEHPGQVDGFLAITPAAVAAVLSVTGPVTLPDGTTVTAESVQRFLQLDVYAKFPLQQQEPVRDAYQHLVLAAMLDKVSAYRGSPMPLLRALGGAVSGGLRLAASDPAQEAKLATTPLGGSLRYDPGGPVLGIDNTDGSKLDQFLDRLVTYRATGGRVSATVTLTNTAPTTGLPAYVTYRVDLGTDAARAQHRPGEHTVLAALYLPGTVTDVSVTVDGHAEAPRSVLPENGRTVVFVVPRALAPGGDATTFTVTGTAR